MNFSYPKKWKLNDKEKAEGKTKEEKERIRRKRIESDMLKVVVYITRAWKSMEDRGLIVCPFNFE